MIIENLKGRVFVVVLAFLGAILYVLPNFTTLPKNWWFKKEKLNYGLDIQGGAHLIYGVDVHGVMIEKIARMSRGLADELKTKKLDVTSVKPTQEGESLVITL